MPQCADEKKKHTECDSSYTIISVPDQEKKSNKIGNYNMAKFELNLNEHKALVVPLEFNTILIYSGFLLTHRQQIFKLNENVDPFINVVSYNSQKLFKHLMAFDRPNLLVTQSWLIKPSAAITCICSLVLF